VERREGELHLRLDPGGADRPHVRCRCQGIFEQCRLTDPGLALETRTPLRPSRAPPSSRSRTAHSCCRPRSVSSRGVEEPTAMRSAKPKARDVPGTRLCSMGRTRTGESATWSLGSP
jgi:hypothetical protein